MESFYTFTKVDDLIANITQDARNLETERERERVREIVRGV
jgi:hypothetical protein